MIVARQSKDQSRSLYFERLERRCLLSADFFDFDFDDLERTGQSSRGDSAELRFERDRNDDSRRDRNDDDDRLGRRDQSRSGFRQYGQYSRNLDDDDFLVTGGYSSQTIARNNEPIFVLVPQRTVIVTIVSIPHSNLTGSSAPAHVLGNTTGESTGLQLASATQPEPEQIDADQQVNEKFVSNSEFVIANLRQGASSEADATALVSAKSAIERIDRSINASETLWLPDTTPSFLSQTSEVDHTDLGRWLERADQLNHALLELEQTLYQLALERAEEIDLNAEPVVATPQTQEQPWLHEAHGIVLLIDNTEYEPAKHDDELEVIAEGWTVGIGFHQALEIAQSNSSIDPIIATINQPVQTGAVLAGSADADSDQPNTLATPIPASQILGVAVCIAGIHYLRVRNGRQLVTEETIMPS